MKEIEIDISLAENPVFISHVQEEIAALRKGRMNRKPAPDGYRYSRNWYDRMMEDGKLNARFFCAQIPAIWQRQSPLNSEYRGVIQAVCNIALQKTMLALAKKLEEDKNAEQKTNP